MGDQLTRRSGRGGKRRILLVGGGYAGVRLARLLDAEADVTLVERRDCFVHCVATIRGVAAPTWLDRVCLPYDRLLARGRVVRGTVQEVRSDGVTLTDGRMLTADYVVLAPGSSYASPFKPVGDEDGNAYRERVGAVHDRLRRARSVAILGAGPVGIELAAEIRTAFPDTSVTLVSSRHGLMPGYRPALGRRLRRDLADLNVVMMLGRRATDLPAGREPFGPASVSLDGGPPIIADVVFPATGALPNTSFLESVPGVVLVHGRILVDGHLQLPGLPRVFALGDAAKTEDTLTISGVERQSRYLSRLLHRLIAGDALHDARPYTPWPKPVIVVPVGSERGAAQLPLSLVVGGWATKRLKGRHLFLPQARANLGLPARGGKSLSRREGQQPVTP